MELLDEMYISLNICTKFVRTVCCAVISCSSYFAYSWVSKHACMCEVAMCRQCNVAAVLSTVSVAILSLPGTLSASLKHGLIVAQ